MDAAIEVDGVSRSFGSGAAVTQALRDVSFSVPTGTVCAVLGGNGAGKTTITKILSTLLLPSSGTARVLGHDVTTDARSIRSSTSVVLGGDRGLYPRLTGRANLRFFGMLAGVGRADLLRRVPELLDHVGLAEAADRRVETYSKGMRQRLHIAIGLASRPTVLLLDEPTIGLDPIEAQRLRDSVRELRAQGVTILLTSHYLLDVEQLADRVVLLDRGELVADLPLSAFAAEAGYAAVVDVHGLGPVPDLDRLLGRSLAVKRTETTADGWLASMTLVSWSADVFAELAGVLRAAEVVDVQVRPARLEEAYARLADRVRR